MKTAPRATMRERGKAFVDGFFALLMPVMILGGIKWGIVDADGSRGARRRLCAPDRNVRLSRAEAVDALRRFPDGCEDDGRGDVPRRGGARVSAWLITQANIPGEISGLIEPLMGNKTLLMFALMFLVVIVGTALDFSPTVLILTPVLMPIVKQAGIDPVYFGVLFIINNAIGLITPPVGIVLNVVSGVARVPMGAVIRGVNPFLIAQMIVLVLLIIFPDLVMVPFSWLRGR